METAVVFIGLLIFMLFLGLVVAFSPVLFTTELAIITRSKNAYINTICLIAGIATSITLVVLISSLFIDPNKTFEISVPSVSSIVGLAPLIDILAGSICIFYAVRLRAKLGNIQVKEVKTKKNRFSAEKLDTPGVLYWIGFFKMLLSVTSLTAILLAVRYVKTNLDINMLELILILILVLASIMPFVLLIVLHKIRPDTFGKIQNTSDKIAAWNYRVFLANLLFIIGSFFIIAGLIAVK